MIEAQFYEKIGDDKIRCGLCPHNCILKEGQRGLCRGRKVIEGKLIALTYGEAVSVSMDPIEKKPLYHYFPGTNIISLGPNACNLKCIWCQNYDVSQNEVPTRSVSPEVLLNVANSNDVVGVAFTYTEPLMMYEFIIDTAKLFKEYNKKIVLVTNGYINRKPLEKLLPFVDAMNIDLKGFSDEFYKKYTNGILDYVLDTIKIAYKAGVFIEITNLLIPNLNDELAEIEGMAKWISKLSPDIPLHFSRYFPTYKCNQPPTPEKTIYSAYSIAKKYLNFVYPGNIKINGLSNTYCKKCNHLLVERPGLFVAKTFFDENGLCPNCGEDNNFVIK